MLDFNIILNSQNEYLENLFYGSGCLDISFYYLEDLTILIYLLKSGLVKQ